MISIRSFLALATLVFSLACFSEAMAQVPTPASAPLPVVTPLALDEQALSQLAIQDHGRKKPFTTFAQESLLRLAGTTMWQQPQLDANQPAPAPISSWQVILTLWLNPLDWDQRPLIFVNNDDLRKALQLTPDHSVKLFTAQQLVSGPELGKILMDVQRLQMASQADQMTPLEKEADSLRERLTLFQDLTSGDKCAFVPHPSSVTGRWAPFSLLDGNNTDGAIYNTPALPQVVQSFTAWRDAFRSGDVAQFNKLTPALIDSLRQFSPTVYPTKENLAFEYHYMTFHPFMWSWITYLVTLLVLGGTSIWFQKQGYIVAWCGVILGLSLEIYGLACRVIISGRPPVTDMYETVIWVSFIAMSTAVLLEAIYKRRHFFYAGVTASVATLIIADTQPLILDSAINPLTAVLRNNYWLVIHVLTIVSAYGTFLLAAALGHMALVMKMSGLAGKRDLEEAYLYIYRSMQIGVLLLATGTILGGIWANYSWGRFWGWDPKEVWALVTLLCYLIVLHGRLAGAWSGLGLAFGSVICWFSVLMSWYGVNYVLPAGKSLHGYGAGTGGFSSVLIYASCEALFVLLSAWIISRQTKKVVSTDKSIDPLSTNTRTHHA